MYPQLPVIINRTPPSFRVHYLGRWQLLFQCVTQTVVKSPEDPLPAWNLQPTIDWFPSFLYFNIYAQPFTMMVDEAVCQWIGTSGLDGQRHGFDILPENLPFVAKNPATTKVRFYVQGVKDCGEVLKWQKCAYVDVSLS
jgi:mannosyl-glycoprotein endo-beta-N-acetylglucosaminidase